MNIYFSVLYDNGIEEVFSIQQTETVNQEEAEVFIKKTTNQIYDIFAENSNASYKLTDETKKVVVINLSKVSSIKIYSVI